MKDVLVLFSFRNHKAGYIEMLFKRLSEGAKGRNITLHRGALKDLQIEVKNNHLSIKESLTQRDVATFDVVYIELWYKAQQQALALSRYLDRAKIPYFSHELHTLLPMSKVGEIAVMADNDIPLPHTYVSSHRILKELFKKTPPISYPLIVKSADGYGGKDNHLVHSYQELKTVLDDNKQVDYVVQEFIPNDCDYRCIVLGGTIKFVLERRRQDSSSHLNNTSAGAEGVEVPVESLTVEAQRAVLQAARVTNRSSFAGVDLMIDKYTGKPYILEVNQTPQIEIGAEVERKMEILLDYVEELAA